MTNFMNEEEPMESDTTATGLTTNPVSYTQCRQNCYIFDGKKHVEQFSYQTPTIKRGENVPKNFYINKPLIIINDNKTDIQMTDDTDKFIPSSSSASSNICQNQKRRSTDAVEDMPTEKKPKNH